MNMTHEVQEYLHYCEYQKKLSRLSLKAYIIDLGQFIKYTARAQQHALSKVTISGYMRELHGKYSPKTVKRKIASLRAFLNYLEFEEAIEVNPMRKIKTKFQEVKQLPKTIPLRTITDLLAMAFEEQRNAKTEYEIFSTLRDRVVLEMLFATGMRVSELCSLQISDVNLEEGIIQVMGKGSRERIIQVENADVKNALIDYRRACKHDSPFFLPIGGEINYQTSLSVP